MEKNLQNQNNSNPLIYLEISESALQNNLNQARNLIGPNRILTAVVKSNAYGHGMIEVARLSVKHGADWLGVNSLEEALCLRKHHFECPIIILGYIDPARYIEAIKSKLRFAVYSIPQARALAEICHKLKQPVKIHLKLETGLNRQGANYADSVEILRTVSEKGLNRYIEVEGIYTHFANIEDTLDHSFANYQLENFNRMKTGLIKLMPRSPSIIHTSCSAAIWLFPNAWFNMVRLGISLYGLWSSRETRLSSALNGSDQSKSVPVLKPVLSWKCQIAQIKDVQAGEFIGYGISDMTTTPTRLAVLPVGYYDGYVRALSGKGYVIIHGQLAKVRGRICMNMFMVDITHIKDVKPGDQAILIGSDGEFTVSADDLAQHSGTINYEVVTRIGSHIKKIIVD